MDQVLLTRFNLPTPGPESLVRAREGWLRERIGLFERFCLPTVRAQTRSDFSWIIYLDPQSPAWLRERMSSLSADGLFSPIYRESVSREELLTDLRSVTGARGRRLLTTNLDNDDGIASDFLERLRDGAPATGRGALYLTNGLIRSGPWVHARKDLDNAFCSVVEDWGDPVTCWVDWHNRLERHMPTTQLRGAPAWLQVVHTGNVSNRVHGQRIDVGPYRSLFAAGLDDVHTPAIRQRLADRLVHGPVRSARETVRSLAKSLVLTLGGKQGLDRLKTHLSALRRS